MKKLGMLLFFLIVSISFSATYWNGEEGKVRVIYKILDPVIVTVDKIMPIKANTLKREFKYSEKNGGQRIKVDVSAPYDRIDEYLRAIYETVYFELGNKGEFQLTNKNVADKKISAKGYFVDENNGISENKKLFSYNKPFSSRVESSPFTAKTEIDVDFKLPDGEVPMGVYTGSLTLNVWFSGGIK